MNKFRGKPVWILVPVLALGVWMALTAFGQPPAAPGPDPGAYPAAAAQNPGPSVADPVLADLDELAGGALLGQASPPAGLSKPPRGDTWGSGANLMGLNDKQKAGLKAIHQRYAQKRNDLEWQIQLKRVQLAMLIRGKTTPDRKTLVAGLDQISAMESSLKHMMVDEFFEVKALLKPEQFAIFKEHIARAIAGMGRGFQGPGGAPGAGEPTPGPGP